MAQAATTFCGDDHACFLFCSCYFSWTWNYQVGASKMETKVPFLYIFYLCSGQSWKSHFFLMLKLWRIVFLVFNWVFTFASSCSLFLYGISVAWQKICVFCYILSKAIKTCSSVNSTFFFMVTFCQHNFSLKKIHIILFCWLSSSAKYKKSNY